MHASFAAFLVECARPRVKRQVNARVYAGGRREVITVVKAKTRSSRSIFQVPRSASFYFSSRVQA